MPVEEKLYCPECNRLLEVDEDEIGIVYQCTNLTCMWQGDDTEELGPGPVKLPPCGKVVDANDRACARKQHHGGNCRPRS